MKRAEQIKWANLLEKALGEGYKVCYDECESCLTRVYYEGELVKEVPNEEMRGSLNVCDYRKSTYGRR